MEQVVHAAYLYLVTGPGGKRYVGITSKGVAHRWGQHLREARRQKWKSAMHDAIRKHGADSFTIEQIGSFNTWEQACEAERDAIRAYGTRGDGGYNLTAGGDGQLGNKHSEEFRRSASQRLKGVPRDPAIAEKLRQAHARRSPEEREALAVKIAAANARRTPDEVARINEAIAASKRGKPRSPDVVAKMKAARWPHLYGELA